MNHNAPTRDERVAALLTSPDEDGYLMLRATQGGFAVRPNIEPAWTQGEFL